MAELSQWGGGYFLRKSPPLGMSWGGGIFPREISTFGRVGGGGGGGEINLRKLPLGGGGEIFLVLQCHMHNKG